VYVDATAAREETALNTTATDSVEIQEITTEQGSEMLEKAAYERFGMCWTDFFAAYSEGVFRDTEQARDAEELAFLNRFAG
jgi:hypothetical protein